MHSFPSPAAAGIPRLGADSGRRHRAIARSPRRRRKTPHRGPSHRHYRLGSGVQIGRNDLQTAADKLVQTGLFAKVSFNFQTKVAGVMVTYHVEESPRIPVIG